MNTKLISNFWLVFADIFLSFSWLLPNHNPPWLGFHSDALAAIILLIIGAWVVLKGRVTFNWHILTTAALIVCFIPWIQYRYGLILSFGNAWISSIYLLGFLFSIQIGEKWELESPSQCADFLFLAVTTAAVVSTGLQFYQWSGLEPISPWMLSTPGERRFFANMAQPNQLASLLLLGLIGCSWGYYRQKLNATVAFFLAIFILLGVVLTESRTAWLNIMVLAFGVVIWRKTMPSKQFVWIVISLVLYFFICALLYPKLAGGSNLSEYRSLSDPIRLGGWKMLLDASLMQPLFGFGWNQLAQANFLVIENYPPLPAIFSQSHNILLDIILWNGYPIGLILIFIFIWWVWKLFISTKSFEQLHLIAFIVILGVHAMLEFPLQYAYFLFPFGLAVGVLQSNLSSRIIWKGKKWLDYLILMLCITVLVITTRDYFLVETSFYGLRFENKNIATDIPKTPPDVIALTQFRDHLTLARNVPRSGVGDAKLQWMTDTVNTLPSALIMYKLAVNLALNDKPEDAEKWLMRMCKTMPSVNCDTFQLSWNADAKSNQKMARVLWPK